MKEKIKSFLPVGQFLDGRFNTKFIRLFEEHSLPKVLEHFKNFDSPIRSQYEKEIDKIIDEM